MNFEGNLNTLFLPNILQLINRERTDGILDIFSPDQELKVYFENGEVIYADGVDKEKQLINLMKRKGVLSNEAETNLTQLKDSHPFALGPYLIDQKFVSRETWRKFIKIKVEQVLLRAFLAENADFKFSSEEFVIPDEYKTDINLMQLILDITRKIDEWNYIKKHIPDRNIIFQTCEILDDSKQSIHFNRAEWSILSKIDGKKTVEDIISESEIEELEVLKILYSFLSSGLIKRLEDLYVNWKGNFVDYEAVISLYMDLFKILEKNIKSEIGREFNRIFDRCMKAMDAEGNTLVTGFSPFAGNLEQNVQVIVKRLGKYVSFNEGKEELLLAFNQLIKSMIEGIKNIVGIKLIEKTLNEIYMTISFVGKYHQQGSDVNTLVLESLKESLEEKA